MKTLGGVSIRLGSLTDSRELLDLEESDRADVGDRIGVQELARRYSIEDLDDRLRWEPSILLALGLMARGARLGGDSTFFLFLKSIGFALALGDFVRSSHNDGCLTNYGGCYHILWLLFILKNAA